MKWWEKPFQALSSLSYYCFFSTLALKGFYLWDYLTNLPYDIFDVVELVRIDGLVSGEVEPKIYLLIFSFDVLVLRELGGGKLLLCEIVDGCIFKF